MITSSFDNKTNSKINPKLKEDRIKCDACVVTFSYKIENYFIEKYKPEIAGYMEMAYGLLPVYLINLNGKKIAVYKTMLTADAAVACFEDSREVIDTDKYIVFGGSGCLNKDIARGKLVVPTEAYRDEGASYHYAEASDYITMKNSNKVAEFMDEKGLPYVLGKTWTTSSIYRETEGNFEKRKADGCIAVEMECSALQAVADFRGVDLYYFLSSGDLLDAPEWSDRIEDKNNDAGTQHDPRLFNIALELAEYLTKKKTLS